MTNHYKSCIFKVVHVHVCMYMSEPTQKTQQKQQDTTINMLHVVISLKHSQ